MPEHDVISGGVTQFERKKKPATNLFFDLLRVRKAKELSITDDLVARYGEEGRLLEEELVTRFRKCRMTAQTYREEAAALSHESRVAEASGVPGRRADLLRKAARLESRATRYQEMLTKRVEGMLARAAQHLYPKTIFAYQELREDFLLVAAKGLNAAVNSTRRRFEHRFVWALMSVIGTAARSVWRADGRGDDGKQELPREIDAPLGSNEGDDTADFTLADTLLVPKEENPESIALVESTASQLRTLIVAALPQQEKLAHRKFDAFCLRFAYLSPGAVRNIIAARYPETSYSAESERLDYRHTRDAITKVFAGEERSSLETEDWRMVMKALRLEGQRIALESEPE